MNEPLFVDPPEGVDGDPAQMLLSGEGAEYNCFPLSFSQERLWFLAELEPESSLYTLAWSVELRGRLDPPALIAALRRIVDRHEILRTRFLEIGGHPLQHILEDVTLAVPRVDLSALPPGHRRRESTRIGAGIADEPFVLSSAPLLRTVVVRRSASEHTLVVALHHIAADGWSMGVL
ncbi:MAG: condensation domain-containing protein, partial [Acidobacteriota bacterium]